MAKIRWYHQLRGIGLITPWLLWLLVADVLLSLLLPLKPFFPDAVYHISSRLAYTVWRWIQHAFETRNGAHVTISGDPLPRGESAIVVANHIGWADFYMVQALALRSGMLGRCRWFAKRQLRTVPFLGWGLWAMGMPLVSRNWAQDRAELERVFRGVVHCRWPTWLISFSESTRYTPRKHAESQKWCEAHQKQQPRHLLYPRTKGFVATVKHLRQAPHVKAVYDLTIAYQRQGGDGKGAGSGWQVVPNFWETIALPKLSLPRQKGGQGYRFHIHARRYPLEDLPHEDEELARWLEERWIEKGTWLEETRVRWAAETGKK